MLIQHDPREDALYIRFTDVPAATTREIDDNLILDLDPKGNVVGIEILFVSDYLSADDIESLTVQRLAS